MDSTSWRAWLGGVAGLARPVDLWRGRARGSLHPALRQAPGAKPYGEGAERACGRQGGPAGRDSEPSLQDEVKEERSSRRCVSTGGAGGIEGF